ncbi:MAG: hypothetical protein U1E76_01355 [Planctomycetota bacterium]
MLLETTMDYRVDVIKLGEFGAVPGPELYWMSEWDRWGKLFVLGVVIRGGGRTVLVNTGPPLDLLPRMNEHWRRAFGRHDVDLRVADSEHIENALAQVGVTPADVTDVLVTPFQAYAIGNIDRFPNARLCLSRKGWIEFHAPRWRNHPHDLRGFCIPDRLLVHLVTTAWPRVHLLQDEEQIAPGLSVFWTGVHHRSSIAVKIATSKGAVIASDCFFKYDNVEQLRPLGINESLEECLVAYDRLRAEASVLLPLYDPDVLLRHEGGRVA